MRPLVLVGIVLVAIGGYIVFEGVSYTSDRSLLEVGEFNASLERRRPIPLWVGGLAIIAGIVLVARGSRSRG